MKEFHTPMFLSTDYETGNTDTNCTLFCRTITAQQPGKIPILKQNRNNKSILIHLFISHILSMSFLDPSALNLITTSLVLHSATRVNQVVF